MSVSVNELVDLQDKLEQGEIRPDHEVDDEFGKISLLHAVIKSKLDATQKLFKIKRFIELGCDVDVYSSTMTPVSMAVHNQTTEIVDTLLEHHEKGHMSDLDILKSASKSLGLFMFRTVLESGKVDTNTTRMKGSHILHYLAKDEGFAPHFEDIFKIAPETIPNPIDRHGHSPLAIAVNALNDGGILGMLSHRDAKIIGKITEPKIIVQYGIVPRYVGNFWEDFPEMVDYAVKSGKENLLPEDAQDIFLF